MFQTIESLDQFQQTTREQAAVLVYFSHEQCNVCKVLKPKVEELIREQFPEIGLYYSDTVLHPEVAAQQSVFAVPTLLVYFDGREYVRRSRNIGIDELAQELTRPYQLMFA